MEISVSKFELLKELTVLRSLDYPGRGLRHSQSSAHNHSSRSARRRMATPTATGDASVCSRSLRLAFRCTRSWHLAHNVIRFCSTSLPNGSGA
jgi:hypothetical protein